VIASYEHSSLFGLVIRNEGKKFFNFDTRTEKVTLTQKPFVKARDQTYKTFSSLFGKYL
jgi:hypothetical protein